MSCIFTPQTHICSVGVWNHRAVLTTKLNCTPKGTAVSLIHPVLFFFPCNTILHFIVEQPDSVYENITSKWVMLPCVAVLGQLEIHLFARKTVDWWLNRLFNGNVPNVFMWSFKFIHQWGDKEMPTSVKQIFVTSDFTMTLFIYRKVVFCWCLLVPVDGGLPVLCDLSPANMRLLTLVMTTLGQV